MEPGDRIAVSLQELRHELVVGSTVPPGRTVDRSRLRWVHALGEEALDDYTRT